MQEIKIKKLKIQSEEFMTKNNKLHEESRN
jgi:hypothetical protein